MLMDLLKKSQASGLMSKVGAAVATPRPMPLSEMVAEGYVPSRFQSWRESWGKTLVSGFTGALLPREQGAWQRLNKLQRTAWLMKYRPDLLRSRQQGTGALAAASAAVPATSATFDNLFLTDQDGLFGDYGLYDFVSPSSIGKFSPLGAGAPPAPGADVVSKLNAPGGAGVFPAPPKLDYDVAARMSGMGSQQWDSYTKRGGATVSRHRRPWYQRPGYHQILGTPGNDFEALLRQKAQESGFRTWQPGTGYD